MDRIIPIHIDIEEEDYFLRDSFLWDASDKSIDVNVFAEWYCEDQKPPLPLVPFKDIVTRSVTEQVRHRLHVVEMVKKHALLDWYLQKKREHRRRELEEERVDSGDGMDLEEAEAEEDGIQKSEEELRVEERREQEQRSLDSIITVELDNVRLNDLVLKDKFQWDLRPMSVKNAMTPEQFATQVVKDTRLDPHFVPLIACHLRLKLCAFWEQQLHDFELEQDDPQEYQRVVQQRLQTKEQAKNQIIHRQQIAQQQQQLMQYYGNARSITNTTQRKYLFGRMFGSFTRSVTKTIYPYEPRHSASSYLDSNFSVGDSSDEDEDEDLDFDIENADEFVTAPEQHIEVDDSVEEVMQKSGLVREVSERDSWHPSVARISEEGMQRLDSGEARERRNVQQQRRR